ASDSSAAGGSRPRLGNAMSSPQATASCRFLFVYGTLRKNSDHSMARFLSENAKYLGEARVPGRLYDLGAYPGMTPAVTPHPTLSPQRGEGWVRGDEDEWVHGDLFELRDPEATLAELDRYEGCPLPGEPAPFERAIVGATRSGEEPIFAWIYWYRGN